MAIIIDHKADIGGASGEINVYSWVLDRLLFLEDDANTPPSDNANKISRLTYETMLWLNQCFRYDDNDLGVETAYSKIQLSLIADVVSYHVLLYRAIALGAGIEGYTLLPSSGSSVSPNGLYIKKGKSDDTEVEWAQLNTNDSSSHGGINAASLMSSLYADMCSKIAMYGCRICRCNDCSLKLEFIDDGIIQPFVILG